MLSYWKDYGNYRNEVMSVSEHDLPTMNNEIVTKNYQICFWRFKSGDVTQRLAKNIGGLVRKGVIARGGPLSTICSLPMFVQLPGQGLAISLAALYLYLSHRSRLAFRHGDGYLARDGFGHRGCSGYS